MSNLRFFQFTRMVFQYFGPPYHLPGNKQQKFECPIMEDMLKQQYQCDSFVDIADSLPNLQPDNHCQPKLWTKRQEK